MSDIYDQIKEVGTYVSNKIDDITENFKKQIDAEYQRGLEDAWNVARKIAVETDDGGVSISALYEMFGTESMRMIMKNNTVYDAIAKLKAYEEKQKADDEIKVGDEVIYIEHKFIVFATETEEHYASLFDVNGRHASASQSECKKTGRHFDIASILEDMRE